MLIIGDEILSGRTQDKNVAQIAIWLNVQGIQLAEVRVVPDTQDRIVEAVAGRTVIEDCAQSIGAELKGKQCGSWGDYGAFSFYPTKNLGACGEGGAFVSRHEDWQTRARHIRVHGSDRRYHHDIVGGNFRMDGFQGALLNVKLPRLAAWSARR